MSKAKAVAAATTGTTDSKKKTGKRVSTVDPNETKGERFQRLVVKRTRKAINIIDNIGNCSNKNVYEYTDDQQKHIFAEIKKAVARAEEKFAKVEEKKAAATFDLPPAK